MYDTKSGSYQTIRGDPRKKPSPPADAPDKPTYGPYCYGDRDVHKDFVAHDLAHDFVQTFSECKYEMYDAPAEWVPVDHWWDWRLIFLGVIHDRCNNWIPRRMKLFDASNKGMTASPEGRVTEQPSN